MNYKTNYLFISNMSNINDLRQILKKYNVNELFNDLSDSEINYYNRILNKYAAPNILEYYYNWFDNNVKNSFIDFDNTIGLDYGCWIGVSSLVFSLFKNNKILACDFYEEKILNNIFTDISNKLNNQNTIQYYHIKNIKSDFKVDWITMYDVLCEYNSSNNSILGDSQQKYALSEDKLIDLKYRLIYFNNILNKNGILIISDMENDKGIYLKQITTIIADIFNNYSIHFIENTNRYIIKCKKEYMYN